MLAVPAPATGAQVLAAQLLVVTSGVATTNPAGKLSVKVTAVRLLAVLGLTTLNDSVLTPPGAMEEGVKVLLMVGGNAPAAKPRVSVALTLAEVPALDEVMLAVVLVWLPFKVA